MSQVHRDRGTIGYCQDNYQSRPLFGGKRFDVPGWRYARKRMIPFHNKWTNRVPVVNAVLRAAGAFPPVHRVDAYHTFNTVLSNRHPWVVTFESILPRISDKYGKSKRALFNLLRRDECRAVIAMSENAKLHLGTRNERYPGLSEVMDKCEVVYPCIPDNPSASIGKPLGREEVHLLFVGRGFRHKGGQYVVAAFERLRQRCPVRLTVVSSLDMTSWLLPKVTNSANEWEKRITDAGGTFIHEACYNDVQALAADADVMLLPSHDESFGFSIVEGMAGGAVPIVTSVRALPEVVAHGETGLVIDVPTTAEGRLDVKKVESRRIVNGIVDYVTSLVDARGHLVELQTNARRAYEARFSPKVIGRELAGVYKRRLE